MKARLQPSGSARDNEEADWKNCQVVVIVFGCFCGFRQALEINN